MDRFEAGLSKALEAVMAAFLGLIVATVIVLVGLRYLFHGSITGANEWMTILFVHTTAVGAALGIGKGEHLAIEFAVEKLPPLWRRRAAAARILLIAAIHMVALGYSVRWIGVTGGYLMPSTGLPRWAAQMSVPIGCVLALCFCFFQWRRARKRGEKAPEE